MALGYVSGGREDWRVRMRRLLRFSRGTFQERQPHMSDEKKSSGANAAASDKRYGLRLRKYIDVVVEDPLSSMLFRGAIADISNSGMRVIVDQYLPKGSKYTFTMKRPPTLIMRGEVRWIRAFENDTFQAGVQFVEVHDDVQKRLDNFIDLERQRLTSNG